MKKIIFYFMPFLFFQSTATSMERFSSIFCCQNNNAVDENAHQQTPLDGSANILADTTRLIAVLEDLQEKNPALLRQLYLKSRFMKYQFSDDAKEALKKLGFNLEEGFWNIQLILHPNTLSQNDMTSWLQNLKADDFIERFPDIIEGLRENHYSAADISVLTNYYALETTASKCKCQICRIDKESARYKLAPKTIQVIEDLQKKYTTQHAWTRTSDFKIYDNLSKPARHIHIDRRNEPTTAQSPAQFRLKIFDDSDDESDYQSNS